MENLNQCDNSNSSRIPTRRRRRKEVQKRCGRKCYYCLAPTTTNRYDSSGRENMNLATVDRIIPGSLGGTYVESNTVLACKFCNDRKSSMSVAEFLKYLNKKRDELRKAGLPPVLWKQVASGRVLYSIRGKGVAGLQRLKNVVNQDTGRDHPYFDVAGRFAALLGENIW